MSWCLIHVINRLYLINKQQSYGGDIHTTISIILLIHATFHTKYKRLKSLSHALNWLLSTPNWSTQWIQQSRFHNLCILKTEVEPPSIKLDVLTNTSDNWKSQIYAHLNNIPQTFTLFQQNTDSSYYCIPEQSRCQKPHITSASNWNLELVFSLWSNLCYFTQQSQSAKLQLLSGSRSF